VLRARFGRLACVFQSGSFFLSSVFVLLTSVALPVRYDSRVVPARPECLPMYRPSARTDRCVGESRLWGRNRFAPPSHLGDWAAKTPNSRHQSGSARPEDPGALEHACATPILPSSIWKGSGGTMQRHLVHQIGHRPRLDTFTVSDPSDLVGKHLGEAQSFAGIRHGSTGGDGFPDGCSGVGK
jgi:hypothetical protein